MKTLAVAAALAALPSWTYAHSTCGHLLVNGTETGLWKHILKVAPWGNVDTIRTNFYDLIEPILASDAGFHNPNLTCGRLAFDSMQNTAIADVVAGEELGFRVMRDAEIFPGSSQNTKQFGQFYHNGPGQIYLSRAPNDDLMSYRGDGEWFKIASRGAKSNTHWALRGETEYNFTLPATTPPGKYIMRLEYFYPQQAFPGMLPGVQWFPNCALLNVMGPGGGTPGPTAKMLDYYNPSDPGFNISANMEYGSVPDDQMKLLDYIPPGPPVWKG